MIVVSDTTPLNYLVLVDAIDLLPKLFREVYAPPEVVNELQHSRTPQAVREWAQTPPLWLKVMAPEAILPATVRLGRGEAAAISLAMELKASAVLIDERKAASVARSEGLVVVRTLALLELSAERGLIDFGLTLQRLQATTFRIPQEQIDGALERIAARKPPEPQ